MIYLYKDSLWVCWPGNATNSYTPFYTMISFNILQFMSTWVYWIFIGTRAYTVLNNLTAVMTKINFSPIMSRRGHNFLPLMHHTHVCNPYVLPAMRLHTIGKRMNSHFPLKWMAFKVQFFSAEKNIGFLSQTNIFPIHHFDLFDRNM